MPTAQADDRGRAGRSKTWFAREFECAVPTVSKRIEQAGVKPVGHVHNKPVYRVLDVAPLLLPPVVQVITHQGDDGETTELIDPDRLPPDLLDKYWAAQIKKLKYTTLVGDLWSTEDVITVFGEAAKKFRDGVRLFVDAVEREKGLTPGQRKVLAQLSDDLLNSVRQTLVTEVDPDAVPDAE